MANYDIELAVQGSSSADVSQSVDVGDEVSAKNAEAWAVGQRGGVDVPSTDPTYHNNAKYYAEQAGQRVEDAEAWANGTRDGEPVSSDDPAYQKNAAYYRGLSQADANAAAGSVTAAAEKVTQAAGHAAAAAVAQAIAEEKAQEAIDTVVAAQGPGIVYMSQDGEFFVLEEEEEA